MRVSGRIGVCTSCAFALAACTPAAWRARPRERPPDDGGVPLEMYCANTVLCTATARGVVTARGGDRVDWYSVTIPDDAKACDARLRIALQWEVPRDDSALVLSVRGPNYRVVKHLDEDEDEDDDDDDDDEDDDDDDFYDHVARAGSTSRIRLETKRLRPGTHVVGVHAHGASGAGTYTLDVEDHHVCDRWSSMPIADVIHLRPPDVVPPRTKLRLAPIVSAGMARDTRRDAVAYEPTFVIDMTDMPALTTGAHGVLVDRRGRDVRHGEFEVFSTWSPDGATRFASARFVDAGWFRRKIELGWSYWFARIPKRRMMSRPVPSFPASDSAKT